MHLSHPHQHQLHPSPSPLHQLRLTSSSSGSGAYHPIDLHSMHHAGAGGHPSSSSSASPPPLLPQAGLAHSQMVHSRTEPDVHMLHMQHHQQHQHHHHQHQYAHTPNHAHAHAHSHAHAHGSGGAAIVSSSSSVHALHSSSSSNRAPPPLLPGHASASKPSDAEPEVEAVDADEDLLPPLFASPALAHVASSQSQSLSHGMASGGGSDSSGTGGGGGGMMASSLFGDPEPPTDDDGGEDAQANLLPPFTPGLVNLLSGTSQSGGIVGNQAVLTPLDSNSSTLFGSAGRSTSNVSGISGLGGNNGGPMADGGQSEAADSVEDSHMDG